MKVNVSIRTIALSVVLFVGSLTVSAHNNDGNLIYNSEERDGVMVEQKGRCCTRQLYEIQLQV